MKLTDYGKWYKITPLFNPEALWTKDENFRKNNKLSPKLISLGAKNAFCDLYIHGKMAEAGEIESLTKPCLQALEP